jgi:hypothetical protein
MLLATYFENFPNAGLESRANYISGNVTHIINLRPSAKLSPGLAKAARWSILGTIIQRTSSTAPQYDNLPDI